MRATLSFQLPEEQDSYEYAMKGLSYSCALTDMDQYLRSKLKYEELTELERKNYQEVRDKLNEFANDYGVET